MCPLCRSSYRIIVGKPYEDHKSARIIRKDYFIVQCQDCKFYYVDPDIDFTPEEWSTLYCDQYFQKLTNWHIKKRTKDRIIRLNNLEHYSKSKIKKFLDVGCGEGYVLLEAKCRGWQVYGVDIVDNRIDEVKLNNINFVEADLISANYPDEYFDCIYLDSIIEHIINPSEYMKELNRIMKAGGVIYVGVPNEDSFYNSVKKLMNFILLKRKFSSRLKPFVSPYHVGGFNRTSIKFLFKKENFYVHKLNNFATRAVFRLAKFPSKEFLFNSGLTLLAAIAFLIRRENYLEVYAGKDL